MKSKKILIVDDEAAIRGLLEAAFSEAGYSVLSVASAEEALAMLEHDYFPVMFVDLGLETMNGFELCEKVRINCPDAFIYALTGYAKLFGQEEILEVGFNDYIAKPFSIKSLCRLAEESFEKIDQVAKKNTLDQGNIERILVIDDDHRFRGLLKKLLTAEGYEVMEASGGDEGIKCQSERRADLIITDMIMPEKNGIDTILAIKQKDPSARFIAISGGGRFLSEIEFNIAEKLGALTLAKPIKREEMLQAIEELKSGGS